MPVAPHQPVDDDLDGVLLVAGQPLARSPRAARSSSPSIRARVKPCAGQLREQRLVLALAAAHDRREHLEAGAVGQLQDAVDDLLRASGG